MKILDATVALQPDWAEGWNARATARYLDDDYDGSMADIAQTLKREPRHLGALMGMAAILEARGKTEDALKVYERALRLRPIGATPRRRPTGSRPHWPARSFDGSVETASQRRNSSSRASLRPSACAGLQRLASVV